jgi:polysaccharide biosynthesis protein PslH
MKILFLSSNSPYPIKDGHSMRTYNILAQIAKRNKVYFLSYFLTNEEEKKFNQIKKICVSAKGLHLTLTRSCFQTFFALVKNIFSSLPFVAEKYFSKEMVSEIKLILKQEDIDVVHVDILPMMIYAPLFTGYPIVLVEHNVESLLQERRVKLTNNPISKLFWYLQYKKLSAFESKQVGSATCCAAVSYQEKKLLSEMNSEARIEIVPNGVDTRYFQPNGTVQSDSLVFVGGLHWFPNSDGMSFFLEKIYPVITKSLRNIKVVVIGKENSNFKYAGKIEQVGFVDDVRPYVHSAKVFIVPLRIGGGTRLKILDAMAMGKAIVSTSIGCEGLEVVKNRHIIIEDDPLKFANSVIELLLDEKKRKSLGENARKLVEEKYEWEIIGKKMNEIYETIMV